MTGQKAIPNPKIMNVILQQEKVKEDKERLSGEILFLENENKTVQKEHFQSLMKSYNNK